MQNSAPTSESKKSTMSPYLASLSETQVRKKVRNPTAFHAASVASKLFGGTNCTLGEVLSYVDNDGGKNKGKLQKESSSGQTTKQGQAKSTVIGKPPKPKARAPNPAPAVGHVRAPNPAPVGDHADARTSASVTLHNLKLKTDQLTSAFSLLRKAEKSLSHGEIRTPNNFVRYSSSRPTRPSSSRGKLDNSLSITKSESTRGNGLLDAKREPEQEDKANECEPEAIPVIKLKSILKLPSVSTSSTILEKQVSSRRPRTENANKVKNSTMKYGWNTYNRSVVEDNGNMIRSGVIPKPSKKVTFFEKVAIHQVPYETRGSTEWQHNLMMHRDNVFKTMFTGPPLGFLSDTYLYNNNSISGWGGGQMLDNWGFGFGTAPTRIRRPPM